MSIHQFYNEDDTLLGKFLAFLAKGISQNPQHIKAIDTDLVNRIDSLTSGVAVDLNTPLSKEGD